MVKKIKHTYFYELDCEKDIAEASRFLETSNGFNLVEHTEDQRKSVGKMVFIKNERQHGGAGE